MAAGIHLRHFFSIEESRIAVTSRVRGVQLLADDPERFLVVARRREVQVKELEARLQIGRVRRSGNALARETDRRAGTGELTRQQFLKVSGVVTADTGK